MPAGCTTPSILHWQNVVQAHPFAWTLLWFQQICSNWNHWWSRVFDCGSSGDYSSCRSVFLSITEKCTDVVVAGSTQWNHPPSCLAFCEMLCNSCHHAWRQNRSCNHCIKSILTSFLQIFNLRVWRLWWGNCSFLSCLWSIGCSCYEYYVMIMV